ncbi:hypothetical protein BU26DRAFT_150745 [Trematosphaeria pertusa]|uniref:Uncharacterized protein n=1 Tax=Trematosphaeria pertusa TaxID=390896 RepID=A0A6A6IX13_9PLEO|nr:uncharacterized protein BU26DRAFT_150745 [Trematosphaeria pertusa]KAF2255095.1 hypothetical protein BU26DRAFT_150745 [Trematosphaeria pertusa]
MRRTRLQWHYLRRYPALRYSVDDRLRYTSSPLSLAPARSQLLESLLLLRGCAAERRGVLERIFGAHTAPFCILEASADAHDRGYVWHHFMLGSLQILDIRRRAEARGAGLYLVMDLLNIK